MVIHIELQAIGVKDDGYLNFEKYDGIWYTNYNARTPNQMLKQLNADKQVLLGIIWQLLDKVEEQKQQLNTMGEIFKISKDVFVKLRSDEVETNG